MDFKKIKFFALCCLFCSELFLPEQFFPQAYRAFPNCSVMGGECDTSEKYDTKTRVTFFGDSRIDYANRFDVINGLDYFLGNKSEGWNVQNFGLNGEDSEGLLKHLKTCLNRTNYPAYRIHQNVAFHIGGNDFGRRVSGALMTMPWLFPAAVAQVRDNNERIVSFDNEIR